MKKNRQPISMEEFGQKYSVYQLIKGIKKVSITDYTRLFEVFEPDELVEVTKVDGLLVYDEAGKLELVVEDTMTDREYLDLLKEKFNIIDL